MDTMAAKPHLDSNMVGDGNNRFKKNELTAAK
jgi:hypothetical protein